MKRTTARMIAFSRRLRALPLNRRRYAADLRSLAKSQRRRVYLECPTTQACADHALLVGAGVSLTKFEP